MPPARSQWGAALGDAWRRSRDARRRYRGALPKARRATSGAILWAPHQPRRHTMEGPAITVMVPLGGLGSRFQKEGYVKPKPFVSVLGKPMILWVIDSLKLGPQDALVIVYNPAWMSPKYWEAVTALYPRLQLVELPGATRPARPARWLAEALATGVTMSDSMPVFGLYEFCLAKPGSMT